MTTNHRVVVVAGSAEGIDALARLIDALPSTFPASLVAHVHDLQDESLLRPEHSKLGLPSRLKVVCATDGEKTRAGCFYVAPVGNDLVFTASGILGLVPIEPHSGANRLFESAALFHGSDVVGVVLSGLGKDGTRGLQAITQANGVRVVQSPSEAIFPSMPTSALLGDNVQHSVMLDQMGKLLESLVKKSPKGGFSPHGM
jgi:two-component system chemotaxis response regulator CheB